jgi:hypothetical protein
MMLNLQGHLLDSMILCQHLIGLETERLLIPTLTTLMAKSVHLNKLRLNSSATIVSVLRFLRVWVNLCLARQVVKEVDTEGEVVVEVAELLLQ